MTAPCFFIERVQSTDRVLARKLQELRELQEQGWSVVALVAPDRRSVVLLGCRPGL